MLLNQYELIYVTQPQLNTTDLQGLSAKVTGFIEKAQGQVLAFEDLPFEVAIADFVFAEALLQL